jgi:chromosome segregation ATPase
MDITSILKGIKGKVLDASHFDLLKHAYELQNQNISQLKSNNEAIKESNQLLQEKIRRLENEIATINRSFEKLKTRLEEIEAQKPSFDLSEVAMDILGLYLKQDATDLYNEQIVSSLPHNRIKVESAIDELSEAKIIDFASGHMDYGNNYHLTEIGKKFLAKSDIQP